MPTKKAATPTVPETAEKPLPATQSEPTLIENLAAPEFYASAAQSFSLIDGMITITFTSTRYDYSTKPAVAKQVVISRVVMQAAGSQRLAVQLYEFLTKNGLGPKQVQ